MKAIFVEKRDDSTPCVTVYFYISDEPELPRLLHIFSQDSTLWVNFKDMPLTTQFSRLKTVYKLAVLFHKTQHIERF